MNKYIPCTEEEEKRMLDEIGVLSFEDLIKVVPKKFRLKEDYKISNELSEIELVNHIKDISNKNKA